MRTKRFIVVAVALAATTLTLTACGTNSSGTSTDDTAKTKISIGSANFPESVIIASIYSQALQASGFEVTEKFNIGSREAYIPALADSIDLIPDYSGNLLQYIDPNAKATSSAEVTAALPTALKAKSLAIYTPASAEDKDSLVVTAETAKKWNLKTIADLAKYNAEVILGANAEFQKRVAGLPGLKTAYGLDPKSFVPIADGGGPATVAALKNGTINVADIYTTDPSITLNNFVVLGDPKSNFAAQNVVPVYNATKGSDKLRSVLESISAKLTTVDLIALNTKVSGDQKLEPATAAKQWLTDKGLVN